MVWAAGLGVVVGAGAAAALRCGGADRHGDVEDRRRQAREAADDAVQHLTVASYADAAGDGARVSTELAAALSAAKAALRALSTAEAGGLATADVRRSRPAG